MQIWSKYFPSSLKKIVWLCLWLPAMLIYVCWNMFATLRRSQLDHSVWDFVYCWIWQEIPWRFLHLCASRTWACSFLWVLIKCRYQGDLVFTKWALTSPFPLDFRKWIWEALLLVLLYWSDEIQQWIHQLLGSALVDVLVCWKIFITASMSLTCCWPMSEFFNFGLMLVSYVYLGNFHLIKCFSNLLFLECSLMIHWVLVLYI